jgi:hypothetical protein
VCVCVCVCVCVSVRVSRTCSPVPSLGYAALAEQGGGCGAYECYDYAADACSACGLAAPRCKARRGIKARGSHGHLDTWRGRAPTRPHARSGLLVGGRRAHRPGPAAPQPAASSAPLRGTNRASLCRHLECATLAPGVWEARLSIRGCPLEPQLSAEATAATAPLALPRTRGGLLAQVASAKELRAASRQLLQLVGVEVQLGSERLQDHNLTGSAREAAAWLERRVAVCSAQQAIGM